MIWKYGKMEWDMGNVRNELIRGCTQDGVVLKREKQIL